MKHSLALIQLARELLLWVGLFLGFLVHKPKTQAHSVDKINSIRVTQPIQGQPIPIVMGQQRIPMGLLDYIDFLQTAVTTKQSSSGGKGFGGSGSTTQTTYIYSATVLAALCQGQVLGIVNVYDTKGLFQQTSVTENFTVPGGGGSYQVVNHANFVNDIGVGVQTNYSQVVNDYGSPGSVTLSGTYLVGLAPVPSSPSLNQYSLNPGTGTYSFGSAMGGKTVSITYTYNLLTITETEISNIPGSPFQIAVENNSQFQSDVSVVFYPSNQLLTRVNSSPAAGQYSVSAGVYTFNSADTGKAVLITYNINDTTASAQGAPTVLNFTLFEGTTGQAAWAYMTSAHPDRASGYTQIAYIAAPNMSLGSNGELPNYTFEIIGINSYGNGISDCNPSDCIKSLYFDQVIGVGAAGRTPYPSTGLFNMVQPSNFWVANGFFISPVIQNQRTAADIIKDWIEAGMTAHFFSEGRSKFVPYGDTSAAGNGVIFIPNTQPVVDLSDDDFLVSGKGGQDPVKIASVSLEDAYNRVQVQYSNRLNNYNPEIVHEQNDAIIQKVGTVRLEPPVNWDFICTLPAATMAANLRLKRSVYIQTTYQFILSRKYDYLEPMDLVTITLRDNNGNALPGFNKLPVRLQKIVDDPVKGLAVTAEEFPWGTAAPTLYSKQTNLPFYPAQGQADPGNVNNPIIFEAPPGLSKSGSHEVWMALSGQDENWGGCQVWMSYDNIEYSQLPGGTVNTPARMGTLTANVASGSDPDSTNYFPVDLTESQGILASGTQNDADTYATLCYADGEFISYRDVNLTNTANYQIGRNSGGTVYVRRGLFGSQITSHNNGASFARLDTNMFIFEYDAAQIGKTIYLKFLSFNKQRNRLQQLSNVTAYTFVLAGKFIQMEQAGKNLVANPGFESNQSLTPTLTLLGNGLRFGDNWVTALPGFANNAASSHPFIQTSGSHSGNQCAQCRFSSGLVIGANSGDICCVSSDPIPITPGDLYNWGGFVNLIVNASQAGLNIAHDFRLAIYDASGSFLTQMFVGDGQGTQGLPQVALANTGSTGYLKLSSYNKIPLSVSGKIPAFARLWCVSQLTNTSGGSITLANDFEIRFDDVFVFPQFTPTGDEIAKQGSISVTYTGTLTYTSTDSSITWSWNINARRTDSGMTVNNYNSSQTVTGLSQNTHYNHYPFIDEINQLVTMVATGGTGTPSWAHSGTNIAWTQEQARGDHFPLSATPMDGLTAPTGGGGGGSGGGVGGSCLRDDVLVRERVRGDIAVRELVIGDWVQCPIAEDTPEGWVRVIDVHRSEGNEWVHSFFNCDDWLPTTCGHPFTLEDGTRRRAAQLSLEDPIPCITGIAFLHDHNIKKYLAGKVRVGVKSKAHVFYAGMKKPQILQHNFEPDS